MSGEQTRRVQTNTEYVPSPNFVVLAVDGTIVKATSEVGSVTYFVEHTVPEIKDGKVRPNRITRELRVELRMPMSALMALGFQIMDAFETLKNKDGNAVVYLAPNATNQIGTSETKGWDITVGSDPKRVE